MISFYIASSRDGLPGVTALASTLRGNGMFDAFAWPAQFDHKCSLGTCGVRDRLHLAELEIQAAGRCDLFIGIARLGKGSHVELGAALAGRSKKIILVGVDPAESVFYTADGVECVATIDEAIAEIVEEWRLPAWVTS